MPDLAVANTYSDNVSVLLHLFPDCNGNGILDACDIDCGPAGGPCDVPGCGQSADCNGNRLPDECEAITPGDFDADGQVDLDDFAAFATYVAGPGEAPLASPECLDAVLTAFDFNGDGDVDLADFATFQAAFTGP